MHDFAVLFNFDSCVTDVSSRLERPRAPSRVFSRASRLRPRLQFRWVGNCPTKLDWRGINRNLGSGGWLVFESSKLYTCILERTHFYDICITRAIIFLISWFYEMIAVQRADDAIVKQLFYRYIFIFIFSVLNFMPIFLNQIPLFRWSINHKKSRKEK